MLQPIEELNKVKIKENPTATKVQSYVRQFLPGIGETPAEYNVKVHGPYNPGVHYGKRKPYAMCLVAADPIGEVKVADIGSWIQRRNFHPTAIVRACSRGIWRWHNTWLNVKTGGFAGLIQLIFATSATYYFLQYRGHKNHRRAKYHW